MYTSTENAIQSLYSKRAERDVFPAQLPQKRHHPIKAVDQSKRHAPATIGRNGIYSTSKDTYPPASKAHCRASRRTVREKLPAAPPFLSVEEAEEVEEKEPRNDETAAHFEKRMYPEKQTTPPSPRIAFTSRTKGFATEKEKRPPENEELFAESHAFFIEKEKFLAPNEEVHPPNEELLLKNKELLLENEEPLTANEEPLTRKEKPLIGKEKPGSENEEPHIPERSVRPKRTALFPRRTPPEPPAPKKERKGLRLQLGIATLLITAGLALLYLGFWLPPEGEIHSSVLVAFGETSTFAGALFGVDYQYRSRRRQQE